MQEFDLVVIGGGSGGVRAARIAAGHGARVVIAEERQWGGTCVVRGCVPKKLLVYASAVPAQLQDAAGYGWRVAAPTLNWPALAAAVQREVTRLSAGYGDTLDRAGVQRVEARARVVAPGLVEAGGRRWRARYVLLATGGAPRRPAIPGAARLLTSDDVFTLPALPATLAVIGGGYVGVELAHVLAGLGVGVTLVLRDALPLRGFDDDVRALALDHLRARGIAVHTGDAPAAVEGPGGGVRLRLASGACVDAEAALAATGRAPRTDGLGLAEAGVAVDADGAVVVDADGWTTAPGIAAVGDVAAGPARLPALTPVAIRQGHAWADTVFGGRPTTFAPATVPTAVFAQPAIAAVGLTEAEARARGETAVWAAQFRPLRNTVAGRDERALIKLVCDAPSRRVLGLHVVADDAAEIVQAAAIAVAMGATKDDLDRTVALHPTVAEELVLLRP